VKRIHIPEDLQAFAAVFRAAGYRCYFVGGAVRDSLLGKPVADWDAASDAKPEEIIKLFRHVIPTGIQHGTVTVRWRGLSIETTTFRVDGDYADGRRPEGVRFTGELLDDLSRRDFTINGMAADPESGQIVDPHEGRADLKAGIVRAIGDPLDRFEEDGLRPMRAIRFACRFGFAVEAATLAAIPARLAKFRMVSAERVRDEFSKILVADTPSYGLSLLYESGLLAEFLPELTACKGVGQGGYHKFDVFTHQLKACDAAPPELGLRLAALLHDIGKPARRQEKADGELSFYGHDMEAARLAEAALKRLKYPNAIIDHCCHLIRHHMFDYSPEWSDAAVRRFVSRVGLEHIRDLARLRLADLSGMRGEEADPRLVVPLIDRVEDFKAKAQAFSLKDLAINGNGLAALGWPKGPSMGRALNELLEAVLDDPELNTPERLTAIAKNLKDKYGV
jgi:poly(A) polymerase/tRNA nucleotidyltransferase (CCA-adding enzyme)